MHSIDGYHMVGFQDVLHGWILHGRLSVSIPWMDLTHINSKKGRFVVLSQLYPQPAL